MTGSALVQFNPIDPVTGQSTILDYVRVDDGSVSPPILHLAPGVEVPATATVLMAGDAPWTWGAFATAYPALAVRCVPNDWAGESTAGDVTIAAFPLTAPTPGV